MIHGVDSRIYAAIKEDIVLDPQPFNVAKNAEFVGLRLHLAGEVQVAIVFVQGIIVYPDFCVLVPLPLIKHDAAIIPANDIAVDIYRATPLLVFKMDS